MKAIQKIKSNLSKIIKVLRHGILSLYSYIRKFVPWRSRTYIQNLRNIRVAGLSSSFLLGLLALAIIIPLYNVSGTEDTEAATGTAIDSSITFTSTRATATIDLTPTSASGTFASSTSGTTDAAFSITTTNSQGYELKIKSTSSTVLKPTTSTSDSDGLSTISTSGITSSSFTNNTWGYLPSYYNSTSNTTKYYPATTSDVTLRKTTSANNTAHNYTIGLGAKADFTKTSGTYTLGGNKGSLVLTYVANPTAYSITFNKGNTTDTVNNMPYSSTNNNVSGSVSATSITITDGIPTRTGYDFKGWCTVLPTTTNGVDSCKNSAGTTGTTYNATGATSWTYGIDRTSSNTVTLYALWSKATVNVTVNFAGSGVTGVTFANDTYGNVTVSTSGNTAALKYGVQYDITGTYSSGYEFSSWAASAGSLGSTTSASTTYSTTTAATLTLTGKSSCSTITFKTSNASSIVFNGTSYTNNQTACVANGTYSIYGTYATKYAWKSWSATAGTFGNSAYQNTTYTVTGNATITLTGQSVTTAMQNLSGSNCTTTARPVYDTRDNYVYWVRKLADGKCWMTTNLDLAVGTTLNASDSNVPSDGYYTVPNNSSFDGTDTGFAVNTGSTDCTNDSTGCYSYYSWVAATAGGKDASGNSVTSAGGKAAYSICPKGWRLPTATTEGVPSYSGGYTGGDFYKMILTVTGQSSLANGDHENTANFYNVAGPNTTANFPLSGEYFTGSVHGVGYTGYFYSATSASDSNAYYFFFSSSEVSSAGSWDRHNGRSVRCVLEPLPTMQSIAVSDLAEGEEITAIDARDGKDYAIKKINGYLWMTQNLRFTGTSLDTTNSNVTSNKTLTYYSLNSSNAGSFGAYSGHCDSTNGYNYACIYDSGSTTTGVWYNYYAATVGTISGSSNTNAATSDICPAGWDLPSGPNTVSGTDINILVGNTTFGWQYDTTGITLFSAAHGGRYENGENFTTTDGYYWSASSNSGTDRWVLEYGAPGDYMFTGSGNRPRSTGAYIRCTRTPLLDSRLTINFGTGISGVIVKSSSPEGVTIGTITTSGGSVDVTAGNNYYLLPLYNSGYTFSNMTTSGGTKTVGDYGYYYYTPVKGTSNSVTVSATTLATTSSTNMQNLSISNCPAYPKAVKDTRDSEVYYVQRLADGKCWMLENLRLDIVAKKSSLTTSNTNVDSTSLSRLKSGGGSTSDQYATAAVANWTSGNSYSAPLVNISNKTTTVTGYGPGRNYVGGYYNYCAASAGSYCYGNGTSEGTSSGDASYDICPTGWHMPSTTSSNNTAGSYYYLYNTAYSANDSNFRIALSTPFSGSVYDGSVYDRGSSGVFWSSTRYDNSSMYYLLVDSSYAILTNSYYRYGGRSVRCVLK